MKYTTSPAIFPALTPTPAPEAPFANIPLTICSSSDLSSTTKIVYGLLNRLAKINASKGRQGFRVRHQTLAKQTNRSIRSIERCIAQLRQAGLIICVRTGRSNYYRLVGEPPPKSVNNLELRPVGEPSRPAISGGFTIESVDKEEVHERIGDNHKIEFSVEEEIGKYLLEKDHLLIERLKLDGFHWESASFPPKMIENNRKMVYSFVFHHSTASLKRLLVKAENTKIDRASAYIYTSIKKGVRRAMRSTAPQGSSSGLMPRD